MNRYLVGVSYRDSNRGHASLFDDFESAYFEFKNTIKSLGGSERTVSSSSEYPRYVYTNVGNVEIYIMEIPSEQRSIREILRGR